MSYAHTRPFERTASYDPDEEEAQELGDSLEELSDELREALIRASRLASIITKMPKTIFVTGDCHLFLLRQLNNPRLEGEGL